MLLMGSLNNLFINEKIYNSSLIEVDDTSIDKLLEPNKLFEYLNILQKHAIFSWIPRFGYLEKKLNQAHVRPSINSGLDIFKNIIIKYRDIFYELITFLNDSDNCVILIDSANIINKLSEITEIYDPLCTSILHKIMLNTVVYKSLKYKKIKLIYFLNTKTIDRFCPDINKICYDNNGDVIISISSQVGEEHDDNILLSLSWLLYKYNEKSNIHILSDDKYRWTDPSLFYDLLDKNNKILYYMNFVEVKINNEICNLNKNRVIISNISNNSSNILVLIQSSSINRLIDKSVFYFDDIFKYKNKKRKRCREYNNTLFFSWLKNIYQNCKSLSRLECINKLFEYGEFYYNYKIIPKYIIRDKEFMIFLGYNIEFNTVEDFNKYFIDEYNNNKINKFQLKCIIGKSI